MNSNYDELRKPGTLVHDRYLVERCLERDGWEICYQAMDLSSGRKVQLRHLDIRVASWDFDRVEEAINRYRSFAQHWHRAEKDSAFVLAPVWDFFQEDGSPFVVTGLWGEHTESRPRDAVEENLIQVKRILPDVCRGLEALHKNGLLKLTLTKDDIALLPDGQVRIAFRAARENLMLLDLRKGPDWMSQSETAPEVYLMKKKTPACDVYSVSAYVYNLLTAGNLSSSLNRLDVNDRILFPKSVSEHHRQVLTRGLMLNPQQRIQTVREFTEQFLAE